jgi:murein DD-endopeptidase / murein LD-carboxypeptidase
MLRLNFYLLLVFFIVSMASCSIFKKTPSKPAAPSKVATNTFPINKNDNEKLYTACHHWLGVPYKFGGSTKTGVDCSGLVGALYKYSYEKTLPRTTAEMYAKYPKVNTKELTTGDLVFFNFGSTKASHVGL